MRVLAYEAVLDRMTVAERRLLADYIYESRVEVDEAVRELVELGLRALRARDGAGTAAQESKR